MNGGFDLMSTQKQAHKTGFTDWTHICLVQKRFKISQQKSFFTKF